MNVSADSVPQPENLQATAILDFSNERVRNLVATLREPSLDQRKFLQNAHLQLIKILLPVYSVNEWQPVSSSLQQTRGSCSQRAACLEAIARAIGIPTRVRDLRVGGSFWSPRFPLARYFIPASILLVWPQFYLEGGWLDFDELHASMAQLAARGPRAFTNDSESLFEAVGRSPVDFLGKTCGLDCARPEHDLSRFVLADEGFFNSRDDAFRRFGSFQYTLRGHAFELLYGGRKSS
jgi:transglutaminase-like putative cysteine protease